MIEDLLSFRTVSHLCNPVIISSSILGKLLSTNFLLYERLLNPLSGLLSIMQINSGETSTETLVFTIDLRILGKLQCKKKNFESSN